MYLIKKRGKVGSYLHQVLKTQPGNQRLLVTGQPQQLPLGILHAQPLTVNLVTQAKLAHPRDAVGVAGKGQGQVGIGGSEFEEACGGEFFK